MNEKSPMNILFRFMGQPVYVLGAFVLDCNGYHWKAVYVKADQLEKRVGGEGPTRVCLSLYPPME